MATTSYKQPKAAQAAPVGNGTNPGYPPNKSKLDELDISVGAMSKSAGDEKIKTDGVKIRGTGAATKGLMARGPMA